MSSGRRYNELSDDQLQELHQICDAFEQALRANDGPTIESQIGGVDSNLQGPLFCELLDIELESRLRNDEVPSASEYEIRFPDRVDEIKSSFDAIVAERSDSSDQETEFHNSDNHGSGNLPTTDQRGIAAGIQIGAYKLLQPIGEGGMGSVWLAEQKRPVRRNVALKIIKAGMDTREVIARFEAERQALALMNHANIAKVLDAGTTSQGRPYFVMELVNGIPMTQFCDRHKLLPRKRLELFVTVCHAVQHAHQKGIIHRDIKPSNVLVMMEDDQPVAKVIDFGLAKATGQKLTEKTLFTALGQMVGTPAYMSPEQADAAGLDIDTRTDVYSLGVLLYELLTGVTPIDLEELRSAGYAEIQRLVREQEPPRMSTRLSSLGGNSKVTTDNRSTDSKRLSQLLRGDLDLIAMKALEKDRDRRYETPSSFAADIQRFLNHEEIEARPASASYRLQKLYRRNKTAVLTTGVVALSLLLGTIVSAWQAVQATKARDAEIVQRGLTDDALRAETKALNAERDANKVAQTRLGQLEKVNDIFGSIFRDLDPSEESKGGQTLRVQLGNRLDEATEIIDGESIGNPLMVARLQLTLAKTQRKLDEHEKAKGLAERALAVLESELGADHRETLAANAELGHIHYEIAELDEAVSLLKKSYERCRKLFGPLDPDTLEKQVLLAGVYGRSGEMNKGLELQNDAFKKLEQTLGPNHKKTISCLQILASQTWRSSVDDELAETLFEDALKRTTNLYGEHHYKTILARGNLAIPLNARGEFTQAIELYEAAIEGLVKNVGLNHEQTISLNAELAICRVDAGDTDKGFELLEQSVDRLAKKLGASHPKTLIYMSSLAYQYEQNDFLEKAIELHIETLRLREAKLGSDHFETLTSRSNVGWCLRRNKQFEESADHYRMAVAGLKTTAGAEHPETLGCMNNFAWSLLMAKKYGEAEAVLRVCMPSQKENYPDAWKTFRQQYWLGAAISGQSRYDEAEPELLAGYQGMKAQEEKMSDDSKIHLTEAIESLISLYSDRNAEGDASSKQKWTKLLPPEETK